MKKLALIALLSSEVLTINQHKKSKQKDTDDLPTDDEINDSMTSIQHLAQLNKFAVQKEQEEAEAKRKRELEQKI